MGLKALLSNGLRNPNPKSLFNIKIKAKQSFKKNQAFLKFHKLIPNKKYLVKIAKKTPNLFIVRQ